MCAASEPGWSLAGLLATFYRLVRLASEAERHTDRLLDGSCCAAQPAPCDSDPAGGTHEDTASGGQVTAADRQYTTGDRRTFPM